MRLLVRQRRVPELLGELRQASDADIPVVIAHEMRLAVEDELAGERARAFLGHARRGGFGAAGVEQRAEDGVHGDEARPTCRR